MGRRFRYEIHFENGSTSRFGNTYAAVPRGTFVKTVGEVSIKGVPKFLGIWATRRLLNHADDEDLEYAKKTERAPDRYQKG